MEVRGAPPPWHVPDRVSSRSAHFPPELAWHLSYLAEDLRTASGAASGDPFVIARRCGLEVERRRLQSGPGLAAAGGRDGHCPSGRILVDCRLSERDARLVCAHELAHHVLELDDWLGDVCRDSGLSESSASRFEAVCDVFALAILIPVHTVRGLLGVRSATDIVEVAQDLSVPLSALATRLDHLQPQVARDFFIVRRDPEADGGAKPTRVVATTNRRRAAVGTIACFFVGRDPVRVAPGFWCTLNGVTVQCSDAGDQPGYEERVVLLRSRAAH